MREFETPHSAALKGVSFVLCDLDDTVSLHGKLPAASFMALEALEAAGIRVIIVTGRPAGWADMIARMWPVSAVVGENGAFYFRYDTLSRKMIRVFQRSEAQRLKDRETLEIAWAEIAARHPALALSADQPYRASDYAVDFCEDVPPASADVVADIVRIFEAHGATAKVSSIHVNAWIGDFNKLQMSLALLQDAFGLSPEAAREQVVYAGDSPNDEPMFAYFPRSVGVANVRRFLPAMSAPPRFITASEGGLGFAELAEAVLAARRA